jgi:hypothetical protein
LENIWIVNSGAADDSNFRAFLFFAHSDEHHNQGYFAVAFVPNTA